MSDLIVVLLGTDHHPFDRLVTWSDEAAARLQGTRFLVQYGASSPPLVAEGHEFLPHEEILALLRQAIGVVCHGGPGVITDARDAGHVPICVARNPARGEHVDDHQQRFTDLVHRAGVVTRVDSVQDFQFALDVVLATAGEERDLVVPTSAATEAARGRLALELDELMVPRARSSRWRHRAQAREVGG